MFPDHFLPNLAVFAAGLATAVTWLRSGMVRRGFVLLVLLLVSADVALVARFVHGGRGPWFFSALAALQIASLGTSAWLLTALARRRWSADARQRRELFAAGFRHYQRDELAPAQALFVRVRRADPWDVAAAVALANVLRRQGRLPQARALYRTALRLDRRAAYGDFVAEQLRRLGPAGPRVPAADVPHSSQRAVGSVP